MAWERRRSRKSYYYRTCRDADGVVKKSYLGSAADPVTQILARVDHLSRAEKTAVSADERVEQQEYVVLLDPLEAFQREIDRMTFAAKLATKSIRRAKKREGITMESRQKNGSRRPPTHEEFDELVQRAKRDDGQARAELRTILAEYPKIQQPIADLAGHVENSLIRLIANAEPAIEQSLRIRVQRMREELVVAHDALEAKLLAEQVIAGWLNVNYLQMAAAQPRTRRTTADFWQRQLDRAQRRYLKAIAALMKLRGGKAVEPNESVLHCRADSSNP